MARVKKWIQKIDIKRGALTRQAKQYGMSVPEFIRYVSTHKEKFSPTTIRRVNLAKVFSKIRNGK